MSRPRKPDALSPAERARRYRIRRAGGIVDVQPVTQTVTDTFTRELPFSVTETVTETVTEIRHRLPVRICTLEEWPFPGSAGWFKRHGYVMAYPESALS